MNVTSTNDLASGNFNAKAANQRWITDITAHPDTDARAHACEGLDAYARNALGWVISRRTDTTLVNSVINMAARSRPFTGDTMIRAEQGYNFMSGRSRRTCATVLCD